MSSEKQKPIRDEDSFFEPPTQIEWNVVNRRNSILKRASEIFIVGIGSVACLLRYSCKGG